MMLLMHTENMMEYCKRQLLSVGDIRCEQAKECENSENEQSGWKCTAMQRARDKLRARGRENKSEKRVNFISNVCISICVAWS